MKCVVNRAGAAGSMFSGNHIIINNNYKNSINSNMKITCAFLNKKNAVLSSFEIVLAFCISMCYIT